MATKNSNQNTLMRVSYWYQPRDKRGGRCRVALKLYIRPEKDKDNDPKMPPLILSTEKIPHIYVSTAGIYTPDAYREEENLLYLGATDSGFATWEEAKQAAKEWRDDIVKFLKDTVKENKLFLAAQPEDEEFSYRL